MRQKSKPLIASDEQLDIINSYKTLNTNQVLAINAFAGAGKSTQLNLLAANTPNERILYIVFNKDNATEAKRKFPKNVHPTTLHSLAYSFFTHNVLKEKLRHELTLNDYIALSNGSINFDDAALVRQTIIMFSSSADDCINESHTPEGKYDKSKIVKIAQFVFNKSTDMNTKTPIDHTLYLKKYSLSKPVLQYNSIFIDESQDMNAVILPILERFKGKLVFVGDNYQSIYGFRNTINILTPDLLRPTISKQLSTSYRFDDHIAEKASKFLSDMYGNKITIKGAEKSNKLFSHEGEAVLFRGNLNMIDFIFNTDESCKIIGDIDEIKFFLIGVLSVLGNRPTKHTTLKQFANKGELMKYAKTYKDTDPLAKSIMRACTLLKKYGIKALVEKLEQCSKVKDAYYTLSTVHKSKGLEYPNVTLDESLNIENGDAKEEVNICYVAMTRAQENLNLTYTPYLDRIKI